jgi:hypothetical protein
MNTTVQGHNAVGGATKRGAPDPSVPVPSGVKAQADRANALIEQAKQAKAANEAAGGNELVRPVVPPTRPNPGVVTGDFDPRNPNPPTDVPGDPRDTRTQSQHFAPPPPPPPVVPQFQPPAPQQAQPQNEADWEHQFKSLKGRYDRDQENNRRLQQTLLDQQRLLAQVGSPPPSAPQGEGSGLRFNVAPPPPGRRVTPAEVTEYGAELMDVVGRRAAEVYEPIIQQLATELQQVRRQVGGVQNTVVFDARVKMYDDLARAVPQWNAINDSPQFGQWLDQIDPISHRSRREFLNGAHNANQAGQVIDIFNTFLQSVGAGTGAGSGAGNGAGNGAGYSQGNPQPSPQQFDLMQLAAPGRAKSGQTQAPQEKGIIMREEIKQFYTEKTQGKWAGREAEAAAIERQIFDAGNEGRIR